MKPRAILKIIIDIAMTVALMLLMSYELIGQSTHEWIGMAMFILFLVHHVLNRKWILNMVKGHWTPVRIWQTVLVVWVLLTMLGSMVSGIVLSREVFAFLPIHAGRSWARTLHLVCAYWGFVGMSLHLGFHWSMMMIMAKKHIGESSNRRKWICRFLAAGIAVYGAVAFVRRDVGSYMLLRNEFVFFDYSEPLIFFFADYIAIMGLIVCVGHYLSNGLRRWSTKKSKNTKRDDRL